METQVKVKSFARYNGHSIKNNKSVDFGVVFEYAELPNYIKLIQLLNENTEIKVKVGNDSPMSLGTFMVKEIKIDHDGQGIVKFNSLLDHVEADNLNELVAESFHIIMKANIDSEEEEEDDE